LRRDTAYEQRLVEVIRTRPDPESVKPS
jgi:hypothetical protein